MSGRISGFACTAWLALIVMPVCAQDRDAVAAPRPRLYADVTVIDGAGGAPRPHQDLLVRGERIAAIGAHGTLELDDTAQVTTIDMAGRYMMPGLIDSHVHLATPPNARRARAILRRALYGGVTAVRDMADDDRAVGELARASLVGEIPAPDIYYAALMAGPAFFADPRVQAVSRGVAVGKAPWMQQVDAGTDLGEAVTLARGTSASGIKIYADLPAATVAAIVSEAHRQHIPTWAHSAVFPARPAEVIAAGVDVVSHVCYMAYEVQPVMLASYEDRTPVDERLLARRGDDPMMARLFAAMRTHGTVLDATGSLFVREDARRRADPSRRPLRCTGATTVRLTRQAWQAGIPISTGTDYSADPDSPWPSLHEEIRFLVHQVGMSPLQAIHAATLVGARAAGQDAQMGSIEVGKLANFVVLDADPSRDIDAIDSIRTTVKRGVAYPRADYQPPPAADFGDDD